VLVDRDLWETTQKQCASNTGAEARNQASPYLLRGMVICAVCGRKMRPSPESRGRLIYRKEKRQALEVLAITVVAEGRDWRVSSSIPRNAQAGILSQSFGAGTARPETPISLAAMTPRAC
jgi:hypothetical protein